MLVALMNDLLTFAPSDFCDGEAGRRAINDEWLSLDSLDNLGEPPHYRGSVDVQSSGMLQRAGSKISGVEN